MSGRPSTSYGWAPQFRMRSGISRYPIAASPRSAEISTPTSEHADAASIPTGRAGADEAAPAVGARDPGAAAEAGAGADGASPLVARHGSVQEAKSGTTSNTSSRRRGTNTRPIMPYPRHRTGFPEPGHAPSQTATGEVRRMTHHSAGPARPTSPAQPQRGSRTTERKVNATPGQAPGGEQPPPTRNVLAARFRAAEGPRREQA